MARLQSKVALLCYLFFQTMQGDPAQAADGTIGLVASMTFTFLILPLSLGFLSAYVLLGRGSFHTLGKVNFFLANVTIWIYFAFLGGPQSSLISLILILPALQIYFAIAKPGLQQHVDLGFLKIDKELFAALVLVPHLLFSNFMYRSFYLRQSATYGLNSIAEILVTLGANPKQASLVYIAAKQGHADLAKRFIELGADPELLVDVSLKTYKFLAHLTNYDWEGAQKMLPELEMSGLQDDQKEGPLHVLSKATRDTDQRTAMAKTLLVQGLDPDLRDIHGDSALIQAVDAGQGDMVEVLLEHGADQSIRGAGFNNLNAFERVLQKNRRRSQDLKIFESFVAHGVDLRALDFEGKTALMQAILAKNLTIAKRLIELGADVHAIEKKHGRTALFFLVGHLNHIHPDDQDLLGLLLQKGADPRHQDARGRDVFAIYAALKRQDLLDSLNRSQP